MADFAEEGGEVGGGERSREGVGEGREEEEEERGGGEHRGRLGREGEWEEEAKRRKGGEGGRKLSLIEEYGCWKGEGKMSSQNKRGGVSAKLSVC